MVALNKTYRETLTPDRSAKDSGLRFYSAEISRWLNRDPIGERGFSMSNRHRKQRPMEATVRRSAMEPVYVFARNNSVNNRDFLGLTIQDFWDVIFGNHVPKAFGFTAGGAGVAAFPGLPSEVAAELGQTGESEGTVVGAQTSVLFFPDTCEFAAFTVLAGAATALGFEPIGADDFETGPWYAGGLMIGLSGGFEAAMYSGGSGAPGTASPSSFQGVFATVTVNIALGLEGYIGEINPADPNGKWEGGAITLGPSLGASLVAWKYELMGTPKKVPKCVCAVIALNLPVPSP
jgi:hypothetical protein